MQKKFKLILALIMMLNSVSGFAASASAENGDGIALYEEVVTPSAIELTDANITFSKPAGIYECTSGSGIEVSLSTDLDGTNTTIYYTTDGSDPSPENGIKYTQPLLVKDRTEEDNYFSMINLGGSFNEPDGNVSKATIIKAKAFNDEGQSSRIFVSSYFVFEDAESFRGRNLKVVSVTTPEENLFDPDTGIYIYPNSMNKGDEWERNGYMEVFDQSGNLAVSQSVGIRINGGGGRTMQQKPLRIYARENDEYTNGTKKKFSYDFFDGEAVDKDGNAIDTYKRILLRNGGNDINSCMIRDALSQKLSKSLNVETQAYIPCVVFINGEFWGLHNIRERYDDKYFTYHFDIEDEESALLEYSTVFDNIGYELSEGTQEDLDEFKALNDFIANNDMTDEQNYEYVKGLFDLDNFIDYYISETYFGNGDWRNNNVKVWKNKTTGIWRMVLNDMDYTLSLSPSVDYSCNLIYLTYIDSTGFSAMFYNLIKNDKFRERFITRYNDCINTYFSQETVIPVTNEMFDNIREVVGLQRKRYVNSLEGFDLGYDTIIEYLQKRGQYSIQHLNEVYKLNGRVPVNFISDSSKGHIKFNNIDLMKDNGYYIENPENCSYEFFKGLPIEIEAVANDGYKAIGINVTVNGETTFYDGDSISITPNEEISVEPVFAEITQKESSSIIINQIYGGGGKGATPISHSFVELYNPTDELIDISGWSLQYSNSVGKDWTKFEFEEDTVIPAGESFLIKGALENDAANVQIENEDLYLENLSIDNKAYKIALCSNNDVIQQENPIYQDYLVDLVSVDISDSGEGTALGAVISKQKSIRRINYQDTNNNADDFEACAYNTASDEQISQWMPKSLTRLQIQAVASNPEYADITGGGTVSIGKAFTVKAVPTNDKYYVIGWYDEEGNRLGYGSVYSARAERDMVLTAVLGSVEEKAADLTALINEVVSGGALSLDSQAVNELMNEYSSLSESIKAQITNSDILQAAYNFVNAEDDITIKNTSVAFEVVYAINSIDEENLQRIRIIKALDLYNEADEASRAYVLNYDKLKSSIEKYNEINNVSVVYGDANNDDFLSYTDIKVINEMVLNADLITEGAMEKLDADADLLITATDLVYFLNELIAVEADI